MKFIDKNWVEQQRQPCAIYTRVMGYMRPVSQFNIGKKSEFYSRKYYKYDAQPNENQKFIAEYSSPSDATETTVQSLTACEDE